MLIEYRTYRNRNLAKGASIVISNRLYTPGADGIRSRALDYENSLLAIVVAYHNDVAIGCITLDNGPLKKKNQTYDIVNTWIKPAYRRKGIASELLKRMKKYSDYSIAGYSSKNGAFFYNDIGVKCIKY